MVLGSQTDSPSLTEVGGCRCRPRRTRRRARHPPRSLAHDRRAPGRQRGGARSGLPTIEVRLHGGLQLVQQVGREGVDCSSRFQHHRIQVGQRHRQAVPAYNHVYDLDLGCASHHRQRALNITGSLHCYSLACKIAGHVKHPVS